MWGLEDLVRVNEEEVQRRDLRKRQLLAEAKVGMIAQSYGDEWRRDAHVDNGCSDRCGPECDGGVSDEVESC